MKFKNVSRWSLKPELDGLLFFAQRMDELLWDFSLDTYKPPALNAPYLCREALSLLNDIENELIEPANRKFVLDELIWSIRGDSISKSLLDLPVEHYVLTDEATRHSEQKIRLEVLARTLDPFRYLHRCFDHLCEQIQRIEKKNIDSSARALVTTLMNMGMSKRALHQKTMDYFFGPNGQVIDSPIAIKDFLDQIYPIDHEFKVYFIATHLIRNVSESVSKFDIELLDSLGKGIQDLAATKSFICDENEVYVKVSGIRGTDVYSAYEKASSKLDNLSDLFTLFYHRRKIEWRPVAIVEQCCVEGPVLVTRTNSAMEKGFDLAPEKASSELNRLLRNFAARGASFDRFNRVADLHGICVSSDVIDNQLVNLWTAFETIVPSHAGGSKIVRLIDAIVPFLMSAYIRRLVQRFHHDLVTWQPWTTKAILNKVTGFNKPDTLNRTLALLCVKEHAPLRDELYEKLKDFHLLRFRAFQLSEMLSAPERLRSTLEMHETKVRWQIRRIYRTRNLIVHSGQKPSYIHTLIENGHDYLDQIIFDVMKLSCGEYRATTLAQAFELAKAKYKSFLAQLSAIDKFDSTNCTFLCRDYDSLADFVRQRWEYKGELTSIPTSPNGNVVVPLHSVVDKSGH